MKELLKLNPENIQEEKGLNTRYDMGDLREIKVSMQEKGFDAAFPLIVRVDPVNEGQYILGAQGHRRLTVAKELGLTEVYAVLEDETLSDADRNLDIIRLNTGKELTLLEQSRVVTRALAKEGTVQGEVAKLLGKSPMFVTNCVKLSKTTPKTQKFIESEKVTATEVLEIIDELKAKDEEGFQKVEEKLESLIKKAGDKKVTRKKTAEAKEEEEETAEEKEARDEKEKEEAAMKLLNKARMDAGKRAEKFFDWLQEQIVKQNANEKEDPLTPFQSAVLDFQVALASYLTQVPVDSARVRTDKGEAGKLSDVGSAQREIENVHKAEVKEAVQTTKDEAKEVIDATKALVKTVKIVAADKIKAAKAKVAAKA